uniref:Uncharacterized protein n=1 Tax=Wuchereria bancrofti TaxID=6293 RepID=A0A1I8EFW6_WUCBA
MLSQVNQKGKDDIDI